MVRWCILLVCCLYIIHPKANATIERCPTAHASNHKSNMNLVLHYNKKHSFDKNTTNKAQFETTSLTAIPSRMIQSLN